jgi:crotonobetaine/carnitine-CoA ligase
VTERFYREFDFEFPDRETWTLGWMLRQRAQTHGDRVYLDVPDHALSYTFAETLAEAEAIGRGFLDHGGEHGDRILMMAPNRAELVLGWYGAALAGMVEVPINTAYAGAFLEHQVRTTAPRFALIAAAYAERFVTGETTAYDSIERFFLFGDADEQRRAIAVLAEAGREASPYEDLPRPDSDTEFPAVDRRDPGAIFFTSGTTGLSKGVNMSHSQLCFVSQQLIALVRLTDRDTHMSVGPLFHGNAQFLAASPDLIAGARFVLRERYSASRWIDQIRDCGATVTNFIGVMMDWTYQQPERPDDADNQLRCIYTVPTPNAILDDFSRRFDVHDFVEQYGMTEISLPVMTPYGEPRPLGAAGLLADEFFEAKIVDPETDEEVPPNTIGEFVIRPKEPWIMLTDYWNMPERTGEASRNMWFHTGDGLKRDAEGWFYFVDRLKDAIRRRGENISSYEVEQAVLLHERVSDVAAVAAPAHAEAGEDEVAVFFVLEEGAEIEVDELREWCRAQLPPFAMPEYVSVLPELPKTPSGKVRKVELREIAARQAAAAKEAVGASADH